MSETPRRPALRYHGGKWRLAKWVLAHFPEHRCYVEPFGGAASVLLQKPRSYAEVYNDLDSEVVNVFRVLRDQAQAQRLAELLILTPFARDEFTDSYDAIKADPCEQARRTIIKSFMGFGSAAIHSTRPGGMLTRASTWAPPTGFRSNSNRSGTTPAHAWCNYPEQIAIFVQRLRGVLIENRDALDVMATHDGPDTLHYVDPPYVMGTRDAGKDYTHEMTDADHLRLAECLRSLRGHVVLSGYPCDLYEQLYPEWTRVERRHLADGAKERTEVLWLSPSVQVDGDLFSAV